MLGCCAVQAKGRVGEIDLTYETLTGFWKQRHASSLPTVNTKSLHLLRIIHLELAQDLDDRRLFDIFYDDLDSQIVCDSG